MENYKKLGIEIYEKGEKVPEAPFWAKEGKKETNPLDCFWIKSGEPWGYCMPLPPSDAARLAKDCTDFAERSGNPLCDGDEELLASCLQDKDDERIFENFLDFEDRNPALELCSKETL